MLGTSDDLQIQHDGTDNLITGSNGDIVITNNADDKDIIFKSDNGSGGIATYFQLDGSDVITLFSKATRHIDNIKANFGNSNDLAIFHNSTDSFIDNATGHLNIRNQQDDGDIIFTADNGSGGNAEYFRVDGGSEAIIVSKNVQHADNVKAYFGNAIDLEIYHDSSNSYVSHTGTGQLIIENTTNDADILFKSDDGSGGVTTYLRLDGSTKTIDIPDSIPLAFGAGDDLKIKHDGTDSYIQNLTGNLEITNNSDDKDIIFRCDDGSGNLAEYLRLDGSEVSTNILTQKVIMSNLPTSDPSNAGQLYNDSGVLKVSAG